MRIRTVTPALVALSAVLVLAWFACVPGLSGGFLFDDYANLPALGTTGPIDHWATFWRYITSGTADPIGRPLALLSFLIDARNWPADPRPFLRTNLILHLINGVLLALLLRGLGILLFMDRGQNAESRRASDPALAASGTIPDSRVPISDSRHDASGVTHRINLAAVLAAGFWLLHPLLVSTTLYIVQREAMLPATFVLLGLLAWLRGRRLLLGGQRTAGLLWLLLGLGVCTALAVLSKANGILLPAFALVLEYTALSSSPPGRLRLTGGALASSPASKGKSNGGRTYRRAMLVLAWLPALLVSGYLLHAGWNGMAHGISAIRPWTLGQRLLTEPRILMDYLGLLWLPRPFTPGLFNDFIHVSTSLLHPATTLPALLAVLGLIVGAITFSKRWPALAAAVLFFFVGQTIESSTLALELYFEHRNYVPAMLMFWPLALWLCGVPTRRRNGAGGNAPTQAPSRRKSWLARGTPLSPPAVARIKLLFTIIALSGLALMTHARASLWGNQHDQALMWAQLNPESPRAQAYAAQAEIAAGHPARAATRLRPVLEMQPDQVQLALNLFGAECLTGRVPAKTMQAAVHALRTTRNPGSLLQHWFARLIGASDHPVCPQAAAPAITRLLDAGLANPHLQAVPGRLQDLLHLKGALALKQNAPDRALDYFNRALAVQPRTTAALQQAALLASAGYPRRGLKHLDLLEMLAPKTANPDPGMPQIHALTLHHQGYWVLEISRLRATLEQDARQKPAIARNPPDV